MDYLLNFDINFTLFLKNLFPHLTFFNYFFSFFSLKGNSTLIWLILIIIALILEERKNPGISKKDKQFIALFLTAFLSTSLLVEFPLKNLFHRQRPLLTTNYSLLTSDCPKDFSFPSGHAATAFAASTVLTFFDKKRKWFYYSIAFLIAYSRIYLGCHYFFDVFFGGLAGIFISKILLLIKLR